MSLARWMLPAIALLLVAAGCHAPVMHVLTTDQTVSKGLPREVAGQASAGALALTIHWPYRAQSLPTSAQRLTFDLSGPRSQSEEIVRPDGPEPTSTATFSVTVGTGYVLTVRAYDAEPRLIASGTSDAFAVAPNVVTNVSITLNPVYTPVITGLSSDNGGPGASLEVYGLNLGSERGLTPSFLFGGVPVDVAYPDHSGTASVLIPIAAKTGPITPVVDGVSGAPFGSFTLLKAIAITPASQTVTLGASVSFAALATADATFSGAPNVIWNVTGPSAEGGDDPTGPLAPPLPPPPSPGWIDQVGGFTADGATGTFEINIQSGRLVATASVTVVD